MCPPSDRRPRRSRRAGFTIVEMLMVLTVLVMAMALIYPSITRMYRDQQLLKAIEQVQVRLAAARTHAVGHQVNYQFRYEPHGRKFVVLPEPEPQDSADRQSVAAAGIRYSYAGELPSSLQFDPAGTGAQSVAQLPESAFQGIAGSLDLAGASWSQPIEFFPDGTSTGGEIAVFDPRDEEVRFRIRPVTGGVTVSPIQRRTR